MSFKEFVKATEGVLLADRPARVGVPRINPTPFSQDRLKKIISPRPRSRGHIADGALPAGPGADVLHDRDGSPCYVGKARSLEKVVGLHLSRREPNPLLRGQIAAATLFPTKSVAGAEDREGKLFDLYLRLHAEYPPANRLRPPRSRLSDEELHRIRIRKLKGAPPVDGEADCRDCCCQR